MDSDDLRGLSKKLHRGGFGKMASATASLLAVVAISFAIFTALFLTLMYGPILGSFQRQTGLAIPKRTIQLVAPQYKLAFLFLTRGPLPLAPLWDKFFKV